VDIGIGIPNTMLDVEGETLVGWATRADERGFSALASIGRIAYPSYDELVLFAAAAAATERIGLCTNVLLAPAYPAVTLAKATASLDRISGGRLTLGLGVGARPDDFAVVGQPFEDRGKRFDRQLEQLHAAWSGQPLPGTDVAVAPAATRGRIPILFGGDPSIAARRAARWGSGYTIGGAPPEQAVGMVEEFRRRHSELGGEGTPRVAALQYFSLGDEHLEQSLRNLRTYYAHLGDWVEGIAQSAARSPDDIRSRMKAYEDAGVDEVFWDPTVGDVDQVDRLADVTFG
jgi:alkanesulfonate monooxygenase SsuD/methylene tetrahydromethanopterin reductase-like flavin-dependent oxidoreductase (luciferase family)